MFQSRQPGNLIDRKAIGNVGIGYRFRQRFRFRFVEVLYELVKAIQRVCQLSQLRTQELLVPWRQIKSALESFKVVPEDNPVMIGADMSVARRLAVS